MYPRILAQATLAFVGTVGVAHARPFRPDQIPNGTIKNCFNCHVTPGGLRNAFGHTIEDGFIEDFTGAVKWGPALAAIDSDGDGRTNGQELGDPAGAWRPGQPNPGSPSAVTNPGVVDAPPTPVASGRFVHLLVLASSLGAVGVACAFRERRR